MLLIRDEITDEVCRGTLSEDDGSVVAQTCEEGDAGAQKRIPPGKYTVFLRYSPKHGYAVPGLKAVPGYNNIEIHPGNSVLDTEGCILVGATRGPVECQDGEKREGVLTSRATFAALMDRWGWERYRMLTDWDKVKSFNDALKPEARTFVLEIMEASGV